MKKLINRISASSVDQIFIATHSSLVSTRLDLRKSILLNSNSRYPVTLKDIPEDTAKFFMKAPNNNILEFILSKKVILVEGDAEFILLEAFYKKCSQSTPDVDDVHILSVGGTSFKRYLDLAEKLGIKTAVIRDNDGDYNKHCLQRYRDYLSSDIEVFYDSDNKNETFEICLYNINKKLCDQIFSSPKRTLPILDYMLKNKADSAFKLLDERADEINIPVYSQFKTKLLWLGQTS
ncbi:TOPRIM nucleotidyl transferase/hydrolase domain-containing protein [Psychrobacter sp. WY6]|uniref:ATP-dependent nuclease n=1 Tax=Psychrobacter sp. WY6 TaxID=2708350 RepID=UPI002022DD21|nr:TOPRIM nucleotidyl transferase/hydrolase domain-containing protein [Psychrobacter sp. WY6]